MINDKLFTKKNIPIIIIGIVIYGAFLRLMYLGQSSFWIDEGFTLMQMRAILNKGLPYLHSGSLEWKDMLIPYLNVIFVRFFDIKNAFMMRLIPAIFGIATVGIGYLLASKLFSRKAGCTNALFLATGYWFIAWSQQVRGYSALIFFVLLFFYVELLFLNNKKIKYFWMLLVIVLCAFLAKSIGILLIIPLIFVGIDTKIWQKNNIVVFSVILVSIISLMIYLFKDIISLNENNHILYYLISYFFDEYKLFFLISVAGFIISLSIRKQTKLFHLSVGIFVIAVLFFLSFFIDIIEKRYAFILSPFIFLYTSFFVSYFFAKTNYAIIASAILTLGLLIYGYYVSIFIFLPQKHYKLEYYTPQSNYKEAYKALQKYGFRDDDILISATPWMDIIYMNKSDYALKWSLTGRESDTNIMANGREKYSGVQMIRGKKKNNAIEELKNIRKTQRVFIVIDKLSLNRIDEDMAKYILKGKNIYDDKNEMYIYFLDKNLNN